MTVTRQEAERLAEQIPHYSILDHRPLARTVVELYDHVDRWETEARIQHAEKAALQSCLKLTLANFRPMRRPDCDMEMWWYDHYHWLEMSAEEWAVMKSLVQ